jgi:hypothetical protein
LLRRTFRIALIADPTEQYELIGIRKNQLDQLKSYLHKAFWHIVPVLLTRRFVSVYLYALHLRDRFVISCHREESDYEPCPYQVVR